MKWNFLALPTEHRYRCSGCAWDGLQTEVVRHVPLYGKPFPVCPGCGKHFYRKTDGNWSGRASILRSYAVHATCGKRHSHETPCETGEVIR